MSSARTKHLKKNTHEHTSLRSQSNQGNTVSGAYTWSSLPAGKPSYSWSWRNRHTEKATWWKDRVFPKGRETYRKQKSFVSWYFVAIGKFIKYSTAIGIKHLLYIHIWEVTLYLFSWMPTINFNGLIKTFTIRWLQSDPGSRYSTDSHIKQGHLLWPSETWLWFWGTVKVIEETNMRTNKGILLNLPVPCAFKPVEDVCASGVVDLVKWVSIGFLHSHSIAKRQKRKVLNWTEN